MADEHASEQGAHTRRRILQSALAAFGHNDYEAVGIRRIVESAGANIAAVSYHFGGKKGLYLATADYLADSLHERMRPHLEHTVAAAEGADGPTCRRLAAELVSGFAVTLLTGPHAEDAPGFIFREQNQPTEAFDVLYERLFRPMHDALVVLVAGARGLARDAEEARMVAHALLGPAFAFRAARTTMLRHLARAAYTPADLAALRDLLGALTAAALDYEPVPHAGETR